MSSDPKPKAKKAGGAKPDRVADGTTHSSKGAHAQSAKTSSESSLLLRTDQLGATLAKGLDLAEAGLSLGLTIVNRVGSMVQNSVLEKLSENLSPQPPSPSAGHRQEERGEPGPAPSAAAPEPPQGNDVGYCIMNRLPVRPGQAVLVSFSINNDSEDMTKRVKLQVEGFVGQISAVQFPGHAFSVKPATSAIAPMDFEKFVLKGALPPDIPSDVYLGKVVVVSDQALEIPVKLIVGPASS